MKSKMLLALLGTAILAAGCVKTVSDQTTFGVPLVNDKIQDRYERSVDEIFQAAKIVIGADGALTSETTLHETNLVKVVEGRVNQNKIWVRIEQEDPKISSVTVEARTPNGGPDRDLAHQISKEIAIRLVH